jgi:hypothetical protein
VVLLFCLRGVADYCPTLSATACDVEVANWLVVFGFFFLHHDRLDHHWHFLHLVKTEVWLTSCIPHRIFWFCVAHIGVVGVLCSLCIVLLPSYFGSVYVGLCFDVLHTHEKDLSHTTDRTNKIIPPRLAHDTKL